jgi:glycosyltransferase involved in cell wall biosynthesis
MPNESMRACLVAGDNAHYIHSLVQALARTGLKIDLIGDDRYERLEFSPNVAFLNFRESRNPRASVRAKLARLLRYYARCLAYMWKSDAGIVHIQGFRFNFLEGVIFVSLYRMLGKTVIYTAHNLQPKGRNNTSTYLLFYFIYRITNHIICHTAGMGATLLARYKISRSKVSVIPHGVNVSVPVLELEQADARQHLGIDPNTRVLLMFGKIRRYKGVDLALQALNRLARMADPLMLMVAGGGDDNDEDYLQTLRQYVDKNGLASMVKFHTHFIPDTDIELFFQAADLLLVPYREGEFQSGVLFLAYRFGLPVLVSDVGSLAEDVEDAVTGLVFRSEDVTDLVAKIEQFYGELHLRSGLRKQIRRYVFDKYSWELLSLATLDVYRRARQACTPTQYTTNLSRQTGADSSPDGSNRAA